MKRPLEPIAVGDRVEHKDSGWSGMVLGIKPDDTGLHGQQGPLVTVRPDHPRPKEVPNPDGNGFVPTPDDWQGWKPITVTAAELQRIPKQDWRRPGFSQARS